MPRARSPDRDKAIKLWQDSNGKMLLKDIAATLGKSDEQIRKWKNQDKWDAALKGNVTKPKGNVTNQKSNAKRKGGAPKGNINALGHGAPHGNKNALGNRGGPGGPLGNKKAVVTGEFETIWFDCLSEDEQTLCGQINTDHRAQVEEEIRLITIRERRMLERIKSLMEGLSEKQRKVVQERIVTKEPVTIYDEATGKTKTIVVGTPSLVTTSVEEVEYRKIEDILKIEEALTRVQDKKAKLLQLSHEFDKGGTPDIDAPQFIDDIGTGEDDLNGSD